MRKVSALVELSGFASERDRDPVFKCFKGPDLVLPSDELLYLSIQDAPARP